ncbi:hypothetical protein N7481_000587 [Penicillium waksmanii]|uniref:uncharacterized protein n=1 Tax=Penicillium waksmanii TaxID=69791 RepID=UPI0025492968|nr:uncharacterized protein N7481_000587 [Penicillium waksmanii]KAJ6000178.1 hypothetical protein N7481_000587 [Penicillium waksmanii]
MSLSKSESDIILNRANVALSRSQRLVASWLPAQTDDELASTAKTDEELQQEEDAIFTAVPETLGIGALSPEKAADGSWNRKELSSNDILRKQLLGRNYDKVMKAKEGQVKAQREKNAAAAAATASGAPTATVAAGANLDDDDDDDDEGRAAMVGKRRKTNSSSRTVPVSSVSTSTAVNGAVGADGDVQSANQSSAPSGKSASSRERKKATSYLDEILAQRASKKKKR